MTYRNLTLTAAAALTLSMTGALATTLDIDSVSGKWENANPTSGISGVGTNSISWGTSTGSGKSGYTFDGTAPGTFTANEGVDFVLGTFTHDNNPIKGTSLKEVDLEVEVTVGGGVGSVTSVFNFLHDETNNTAGTCEFLSVTPCADNVVATLNVGASDAFTIGTTEYVFTVTGFKVGGILFDSFVTQENGANTAQLIGSFVTKSSVSAVPLPAAAWMLLAGLGGLGYLGRRKTA